MVDVVSVVGGGRVADRSDHSDHSDRAWLTAEIRDRPDLAPMTACLLMDRLPWNVSDESQDRVRRQKPMECRSGQSEGSMRWLQAESRPSRVRVMSESAVEDQNRMKLRCRGTRLA